MINWEKKIQWLRDVESSIQITKCVHHLRYRLRTYLYTTYIVTTGAEHVHKYQFTYAYRTLIVDLFRERIWPYLEGRQRRGRVFSIFFASYNRSQRIRVFRQFKYNKVLNAILSLLSKRSRKSKLGVEKRPNGNRAAEFVPRSAALRTHVKRGASNFYNRIWLAI